MRTESSVSAATNLLYSFFIAHELAATERANADCHAKAAIKIGTPVPIKVGHRIVIGEVRGQYGPSSFDYWLVVYPIPDKTGDNMQRSGPFSGDEIRQSQQALRDAVGNARSSRLLHALN